MHRTIERDRKGLPGSNNKKKHTPKHQEFKEAKIVFSQSLTALFFVNFTVKTPLVDYENIIAVPATAITAPTISRILIFSLNSTIENGIINTGTIAMIVLACPVVVY